MSCLLRLFPLAAIRRQILLLFTLLFTVPLLAETEGNFTYSVSNGQATITDFPTYFPDYPGDLTIPTTLGGYPVTAIGDWAFEGCRSLTSVKIPEGVTTLGYSPFHYCLALASVTIPSSVTSIGEYAFYGCRSLTSVTIPPNLTTMSTGFFSCCSSLTSVAIPSSVTSIGEFVFESCDSLTAVTFSGKPCSVYDTFPVGAQGYYLTKDATEWEAVIGSDGTWHGLTMAWNDMLGWPYTLSADGTITITGLPENFTGTELVIPSVVDGYSVTAIGDFFVNSASLSSVVISEGVTYIGKFAFSGCSELTYVVLPSTLQSMGESVFWNCSALTSVTIPGSLTAISKRCFRYCTALISVTIEEGVKAIETQAFQGCPIRTLNLPTTLEALNGITFLGCDRLEAMTIPENVTFIDEWVFSSCSSLTSVTFLGKPCSAYDSSFPAGVQGYYPVKYAAEWEAVIGSDGLWNGLSMAREVVLDWPYTLSTDGTITITGLPENFTGTELVIPSVIDGYSVTAIGDEAFYKRTSLTSVTISSGVTSIGSEAFFGCNFLTAVTIPSSVTAIGDYAFYGCSSLSTDENGIRYESQEKRVLIDAPESLAGEFVIPSSVRFIHNAAFSWCSSLTSVTIPEGVTSIGNYEFYKCSSLTSVTIPSSVTSIGKGAFFGAVL